MLEKIPIAVIDIGSNSVRMVIYDGLHRTPVPIFNEKILAGLGHGVALNGELGKDAIERTLSALKRFAKLCQYMNVGTLKAFATAAVREATNATAFIDTVEKIIGAPLQILSGKEEAQYAAYGVQSGIWKPDGLVGDLGGGSLEIMEIKNNTIGEGTTLKIGTLWLYDAAKGDLNDAREIVREQLKKVRFIPEMAQRNFYAIGGSWRALIRLHMLHKGYRLSVTHQYQVPCKEMMDFCQKTIGSDILNSKGKQSISTQRLKYVSFGAVVLYELLKRGCPDMVVASALGVREGLLFSLLGKEQKEKDALMSAAENFSASRSRSMSYAHSLLPWVDNLFDLLDIKETTGQKRLRHAACLLADVGWMAAPDYRGEQTLTVLANAAFSGVDHQGRAFLALAAYYRYEGPRARDPYGWLTNIAGSLMTDRARFLGAVLRMGHVVSGMEDRLIAKTHFAKTRTKLQLVLHPDLQELNGEVVGRRLDQLAKLIDLDSEIIIEKL